MSDLASAARRAALSFAALALLGACGDTSPGSSPPTQTRTEPAAPAPPPAAPPAPAPAPAEPPAAPAAGDPAGGAPHYALYCASCHGEKGCGDGPLSATLTPKPAKHCDGTYMNALADDYLFKVVKEGGAAVGKSPLMAPWGGTLSDAQIRDVVAFVRSLADPPYPAPKG